MALAYSFANICGAPFQGGRIAFTPDGSALAAPCSNRVSTYDLRHNRVTTLPFEARQNIKHISFAPNTPFLLSIDESGRCLIVNFVKGIVLSRTWFRGPVADAKFSPCGRYFVVAVDRKLRIWDAPTAATGWQLSLRREIQQHADRIVSVNWSRDSCYLCTASRDLTVRIFSKDPIDGFKPVTFVDHRHPLRGAFFSHNMTHSVSRDGVMISWSWISANNEDSDSEQDDRKNYGHHIQPKRPSSSSGNNIHSRLRKKCQLLNPIDLSATASEAASDSSLPDDKFPRYVDGRWALAKKVFCGQAAGALVVRCEHHGPNGLSIVGFSNGVIGIYECPGFDALYTLSIGSEALDTVAINSDGEWIGMGSSQFGQLVVWEWRSETYILKQQSHSTGVRCVACSPALDSLSQARTGGDRANLGLGQRNLTVATGGEDGKLKLWDVTSGFNYMTFTEHTAPINDLVFTPQGNAVLSASHDGSVRAFDMARYRNFRTFTATTSGLQFVSVAVDGGGEVVVAGSQGAEYSVFVWSIQTGKLLEVLSGHQACVSSVRFHPHPSKPGTLMSGSWDGTLRIWDVFGRTGKGGAAEPLVNSSGVLSAAFDPRGNDQVAVATFSGNIWFWDIQEGVVLGSIDGLRDIHSGRRIGDKFTANNTRAVTKTAKKAGTVGAGVNQNQHFTSITYSSNGTWLLAASKTSARVCIYCTERRHLLHAVAVSCNMSFDGILMELNSKFMTENGLTVQELDLSDSDEDADEITKKQKRMQQHLALPGVNTGELKGRKSRNQFTVWQVTFSQDGQQWCAATSHGLFSYTVDIKGSTVSTQSANYVNSGHLERFSPNIITRNVSTQSIHEAIKTQPSKAMILALALNDFDLLTQVYVSIRYDDVPIVVQSIPPLFLPALLNFLRVCFSAVVKPRTTTTTTDPQKKECQLRSIGGSPHIQYHLRWLTSMLSTHLSVLQHIDPAFVSGHHQQNVRQISKAHDNEKTQLMTELGNSHGDLRSLCLLLLRNVQHVHASLNISFGSNLRALDFILAVPVQKKNAYPN